MSDFPSENAQKASPHEVELIIPMMQDMELTATQTACSIAQHMKFDEDRIDEVKMALIEAIINAFEHSNSPDKKVRIRFVIGEENLTVIIQDHGKGFELEKITRPEIDKKIHDTYKRGWGLMLIENLMDTVYIESNTNGTTLVMSKNRV
jgi:serine/threonine-protein kinase RsbW